MTPHHPQTPLLNMVMPGTQPSFSHKPANPNYIAEAVALAQKLVTDVSELRDSGVHLIRANPVWDAHPLNKRVNEFPDYLLDRFDATKVTAKEIWWWLTSASKINGGDVLNETVMAPLPEGLITVAIIHQLLNRYRVPFKMDDGPSGFGRFAKAYMSRL